MMKKYILIVVTMMISSVMFAQDFKDQLKEADKLFKLEQYEEASKLYKKIISIDPTDANVGYKYGACVIMLNQSNDDALSYLLIAEKSGKSDKEIAYFIARAYENKKEYKKASAYYERFLEVADKNQIKQLKVKKHLKNCNKKQQ